MYGEARQGRNQSKREKIGKKNEKEKGRRERGEQREGTEFGEAIFLFFFPSLLLYI